MRELRDAGKNCFIFARGVTRTREFQKMSEGKDDDASPPSPSTASSGSSSAGSPGANRPAAEKFKMPRLGRPGATSLSVACYAGDAGRAGDLLGANNGAF